MKNIIIVAWEWLVKSSADPNKVSLTIKGAIATAVIVLGYLGIAGQPIDATEIGNNVGEIVVQAVAAVTALTTIYGAGRKIWNTITKIFSK